MKREAYRENMSHKSKLPFSFFLFVRLFVSCLVLWITKASFSHYEEKQPPSVHALRLGTQKTDKVEVDGLLSEDAWQKAEAATGFRQREPIEGAQGTERTEIRVIFDTATLYIGVIL